MLGALLDATTVNAADYGIEKANLEAIGRRHSRPRILLDQLNLKPYGEVSCFYDACSAAAADVYPLDTPELRKRALEAHIEGWQEIVKKGLVTPGFGGRVADGVDAARRSYNAKMPSDRQVRSYRLEVPEFNGKESTVGQFGFYRSVEFGWAPVIGRYSTKELLADQLDNGTIENDDAPSGNGKYGHLCRYSQLPIAKFPCGYGIFDNYQGRDGQEFNGGVWRNVYGLDDIEVKRANGQVFKYSYIFLPWHS